MADVVQLTERLCRVRTPNPGGDQHALAVLLAEELAARRGDQVAVVCGPGDIAQAHAADEWVALADLHAARDRYAGVYRACGRAEER